MRDRAIALFALIVLTGFLAILVLKLREIDLGILIAITLALAYWDFFRPSKS